MYKKSLSADLNKAHDFTIIIITIIALYEFGRRFPPLGNVPMINSIVG
jgi:hypothetical protein